MKQQIVLSVLAAGLLSACDPMRRINMKNRSTGTAEVIWHIKEDSINTSPFFLSSAKEVNFSLRPNDTTNDIRMSFGVGTWTRKAVRNLADDLDSLIIKWSNREIRLGTYDEINNYLLARRKGVGKDKIEIIIRE